MSTQAVHQPSLIDDQRAIYELLDAPPPTLSRPLALIDGRAYAATWLHLRTTSPPSPPDPNALVVAPTHVSHHPPAPNAFSSPAILIRQIRSSKINHQQSTRRQLYVVRDDGRVFGPGADAPLEALEIEIDLPDLPPDELCWRRAAVERYRADRPPIADQTTNPSINHQRSTINPSEPSSIFARLASVYDAFVDFSGSLGDQPSMCALGACFSLATWVCDAFPVVPYLWIGGGSGAGKTQLGTIWARTSYLGQSVLAGSSYSALRDLATSGAALYFDDAEAFGGSGGQREKRELLLAGNRRGVRVPRKTIVDGRWQTRWLTACTPRAFSAIAVPDPTLASRAVFIPLARSLDPTRGNRDVADDSAWPTDPRALQDDCWAFGLAHLPRAAAAWRSLTEDASLVGREFEKWRPLLAVARLLADHGIPDLEPQLRALIAAHQDERAELVDDDETLDVVRALVSLAEFMVAEWRQDRTAKRLLPGLRRRPVFLANAVILESIRLSSDGTSRLARPADRATATRFGRIMAHLRFRPSRVPGTGRRGWLVSVQQALAVARAYGVPSALEPPPP